MLYNSKHFIYPPRAEDAIPRSATTLYAELHWIAQYKYNDSHALIKILPTTNADNTDGTPDIQLWNRHGQRMEYKPTPELLQQIHALLPKLGLDPKNWHLLDGGILDRKHRAIKDTLVIWDILVANNNYLDGTTYTERYNQLLKATTTGDERGDSWNYTHHINPNLHNPIDFGYALGENILLPRCYTSETWDTLWNNIETANAPFTTNIPGQKPDIKPVLEGLVYKDPNGTLQLALKTKNNGEWMAKSRVQTGRHNF